MLWSWNLVWVSFLTQGIQKLHQKFPKIYCFWVSVPLSLILPCRLYPPKKRCGTIVNEICFSVFSFKYHKVALVKEWAQVLLSFPQYTCLKLDNFLGKTEERICHIPVKVIVISQILKYLEQLSISDISWI